MDGPSSAQNAKLPSIPRLKTKPPAIYRLERLRRVSDESRVCIGESCNKEGGTFLCAENRQGYPSMDCWYEGGYDLSAGIPTLHVA